MKDHQSLANPHPSRKFSITVDYDETTGCISDYCTSRGFPLGGIGTGGFNILTDGGFGHFRTNHNWFRFIKGTRYPKGTFFAVCVQTSTNTTSRILRRHYHGGTEFKNIAPIAHARFTGKIPHFQLAFEDADLQAIITLSGFSTIIPHDPKDSTLPVAFFTATATNPLDAPVDVSILLAFENILGLGGSGGSHLLLRDGPVVYRGTRGNYAENFECEGGRGVCFKTAQNPPPNDPCRRVVGEYIILTPASTSLQGNVEISSCTGWSSKENKPRLLDLFTKNGNLAGLAASTNSNSGATCVKFTLAPGHSRSVDFILIWWMPFHVLEKHQRVRKQTRRHAGTDYGHYYLNFFQDAIALAEYCIRDRERLATESRKLEGILKESSLPPWLQTYVLNSVDAMLVNTCVPRDGSYYMIEGCPWDWIFGGLTGTLDQRLAAHPYSSVFFPEFDRRELETFRDLSRNGHIPHGDGHCDIVLGTEDVPYGLPIRWITPARHWTDLPQSLILQVGKLFMITGDWALLHKSWPSMLEMMEYLQSRCDQHIPDGVTTYDYMYYHPHFIYSATLQLATLRMMAYLGSHLLARPEVPPAEVQALESLVKAWNEEYQLCSKAVQDILWNPEGYFKTCESRDTIFTSALAGDWIARYSGLDPVISLDQARSHSEWQSRVLVDSHDHLASRGEISHPLVYREASPNGHEIPMRIGLVKTFQVNNPWQSLAFQAFEAIYLGRVQAGLAIIKRIWEKGYYEGYPWNMDHWGFPSHVYMTHPTMWAVFNALTGAALDVPREELTLSPRLLPGQETFRVPVFFPLSWLWVTYDPFTKIAGIEILKSFNDAFVIKNIICIGARGNRQEIPLSPPLWNVTGERLQFEFMLPIFEDLP